MTEAKGVTKGTKRAVTDDTVHQERGEEGEFARNSFAKALLYPSEAPRLKQIL